VKITDDDEHADDSSWLERFDKLPKNTLAIKRVALVELRYACMSTSNPWQCIYHLKICQSVRKSAGDDLQKRVRCQVLVIVDIWLDPDATNTSNCLDSLFVKGQLDIGFSELEMFEAARSISMEQSGGGRARANIPCDAAVST